MKKVQKPQFNGQDKKFAFYPLIKSVFKLSTYFRDVNKLAVGDCGGRWECSSWLHLVCSFFLIHPRPLLKEGSLRQFKIRLLINPVKFTVGDCGWWVVNPPQRSRFPSIHSQRTAEIKDSIRTEDLIIKIKLISLLAG